MFNFAVSRGVQNPGAVHHRQHHSNVETPLQGEGRFRASIPQELLQDTR